MNKELIEITTLSNLFIGGMPVTFEIGGVDLATITDYQGYPIIPASSLKGVMRRIVRDMAGETIISEIKIAYQNYLSKMRKENERRLEDLGQKLESERMDKMKKRFEKAYEDASAEYLFGIQGFNDTPKLIFNDLLMAKKEKNWDSIDTKTSIDITEAQMRSNPRTYRTVRPNITFQGEILFYHMNELEGFKVSELLTHVFEKLSQGTYRLGNSGSRGYGRIQIKRVDEG